jgi:hypothetical protein
MLSPSALTRSESASYPKATVLAPLTLSVATRKSASKVRLTLPETSPLSVMLFRSEPS